jgi:ornithine decarboxylase
MALDCARIVEDCPCADRLRNAHLLPLIETSRQHPTPAFWINGQRVRQNYGQFVENLPGAQIFYAVKANPYPGVLRVLKDMGASFDAASLAETRTLLRLGVAPKQIAFTTPVKPVEEIKAARRLGIEVFVADCPMEVDKLGTAAPGSHVLIRIQAPNAGSQWPLSRRFGIGVEHAVDLLKRVRACSLMPLGLTFHVGSQCMNPGNWVDGIQRCAAVWTEFERVSGHPLSVLDLGGGFPVQYIEAVPAVQDICLEIRAEITRAWGSTRVPRLWIEPGRAIVADAAVAVSSVIGRVDRGGATWVFCDLGAFNGLLELIEPSSKGFEYEVCTDVRNGDRAHREEVTLAGPSCDGDDVLSHEVTLPGVTLGDRIYFLRAGAYSLAYCSRFCGNTRPKVHVV